MTRNEPIRVCVCIVFNHPFPKVLPILREIYKGRFSKLLFFMPFERMEDEDVITVYHGCYASPAYITESRHILERIDCDAFMFVHDDVILNPLLDETNFHEYFPLGPDDGFIPVAESPPEGMGDWAWYFGSVPRMLYPKSLLFSGGIEFENVYKYLPDGKQLARKLEGLGIHHKTFVKIDANDLPDVDTKAAQVLFRGITRSGSDGLPVKISDSESLQDRAERLSLDAARSFTRAMLATLEADDPDQVRGTYIDLPFPLISTGYLSDFYILPKSRLADFAHYAGVFTAANIWHETMVATTLFAICETVYIARDFGLNFAGFTERPGNEAFYDPKYMAIHPVKLSRYLAPDAAAAFLGQLADVRAGRRITPTRARSGVVPLGGLQETFIGQGWHGAEGWGRWAAALDASFDMFLPDGFEFGVARIRLLPPLHPDQPELTGAAIVNGTPVRRLRCRIDDAEDRVVDIPAAAFVSGINTVGIRSDRIVAPSDLDPAARDGRKIGFGLLSIEFI